MDFYLKNAVIEIIPLVVDVKRGQHVGEVGAQGIMDTFPTNNYQLEGRE